MPYIQLQPAEIEIEIPSIEIGSTVIRRKAKLFSLIYNKGSKEVSVAWTVKHYAATTADGYGQYLDFIPDWSKTSVADNSTMCDVTNGFPIQMIEVGHDEDGDPIFDYDPAINYTGQYDFFSHLAETQPVLIHQMIIQFGNQVKSWEKQ
jgi:hypothetical protein